MSFEATVVPSTHNVPKPLYGLVPVCPLSEPLLQDESDNCYRALGEFAEATGALQLCFLVNTPRSHPLKAQFQGTGSGVVPPQPPLFFIPCWLRQCPFCMEAQLPSLIAPLIQPSPGWIPFTWLILLLP